MTSSIDKKLDVDGAIDIPIKLDEVQTTQFLFYLANKIPLTATELAADCISDADGVKSQVQTRFASELNIGMADTITLSGTARKAVIAGGKPYIESGQQSLHQGRSSEDEGELQAAADLYRQAVTLFQVVKTRFEAVDHESAELNDVIETSKQRHDEAAKEAAKDTVNYHTLLATQYESEGDECRDSDTSTAVSKYEDAKEELLTAHASAEDYNESRLTSESTILSLDPIESKVQSVSKKAREVDIDSSEAENSGDKHADNSPHVSATGGNEALSENNTDIPSSDQEGIKASTDGAQSENNDNQDTSNLRQQANNAAGQTVEPEAEAGQQSGVPSPPSEVADNAVMDVWATISDNTRHTREFVVKLTEIETSEGVVNDFILTFVDPYSNEIPMEVWKTHELDIDWAKGVWYAISNVNGSAWEVDPGEFEKRLNSTERTEVIELDYDLNPAEFGAAPVGTNRADAANDGVNTEPSTSSDVKTDEPASTIDTNQSTNSESNDVFAESGFESAEVDVDTVSTECVESEDEDSSQESPTHSEPSGSKSKGLTDDSEQTEDESEEDGILGDIVSDFDDID